jgi:hypothetical protein
MVDSQVLELYIGADQAPYWDIYTTPAHTATNRRSNGGKAGHRKHAA